MLLLTLTALLLPTLAVAAAPPPPIQNPQSKIQNSPAPYLSPTRLALHPLTNELYILLSTANSLAIVDPATEKLTATYPLGYPPPPPAPAPPTAPPHLYITENSSAGNLHIYTLPLTTTATTPIIPHSTFRIPHSSHPTAIVINKSATRAYIANRFTNDLSILDISTPAHPRELARLPLLREPKSLALSPDETLLAVGNYLPHQSSLAPPVTARVTLVDTASNTILAHIPLHDGTHSIEDVRFSKDGALLYATHILSRYYFPTTQVDRGWMNTNAVSLIDIPARKYYTTLLLDDVYRGAANPCGMTLSPDGTTLHIAASGVHELITISLTPALAKIKQHPNPAALASDLTFLAPDKTRTPTLGLGPRHVIATHNKLFITDYFSAALTVLDTATISPATPANARLIKLGHEPAPDKIRLGEQHFADAGSCFQQWQSCITCHPGARADGLNWDLLNDGIGNPKNTKSMLYAHVTPPAMITGIRADAETAVRSGLRHIQFTEPREETATSIDEYLKSLRPVPSPHLVDGKLSEKARQGEKLFARAKCNTCHRGPYCTDLQKYDVGTGTDESAGTHFDTPTLREVWRTAPYLYNGSALTIREVLTTFNKADKHGETSKLTDQEIEALEQYILSL